MPYLFLCAATLFLSVGFPDPLLISFLLPCHTQNSQNQIDDEALSVQCITDSLQRVPTHLSMTSPQTHYGGMAPSSIEYCSVLPPISYIISDFPSLFNPNQFPFHYTFKVCLVVVHVSWLCGPVIILFGCYPPHLPHAPSLDLSSNACGSQGLCLRDNNAQRMPQ